MAYWLDLASRRILQVAPLCATQTLLHERLLPHIIQCSNVSQAYHIGIFLFSTWKFSFELHFPGQYFEKMIRPHHINNCIVTYSLCVTDLFALSLISAISIYPCDEHFSNLWAPVQLVLPSGYSAGRLKEPTAPCALLRFGVLRDVIEMCLLIILNSHLIPTIIF
jgi:hypothetical protein